MFYNQQSHKLHKFAVTLTDTEYNMPLTYHVHAENKDQAKNVAIAHACREQGIPSEQPHPFKVERVKAEQ